jgi:hypothetical protein
MIGQVKPLNKKNINPVYYIITTQDNKVVKGSIQCVQNTYIESLFFIILFCNLFSTPIQENSGDGVVVSFSQYPIEIWQNNIIYTLLTNFQF